MAGGAFWLQRPVEYQAATTLVVLPQSSASEAASYYDTLSRGQITTTLAEILSIKAVPDDGSAEIAVEVVPDTSLIEVSATAADADAAEEAADQALGQAEPYFNQLGAPYQVSVVDTAEGSATEIGLAAGLLAAVIAAVSLIAGLATYMAVRSLQVARQQTRVIESPAPVEAAGATVPVRMTKGKPDREVVRNPGDGASTQTGRRESAADPLSQQTAR